MRALLQDVRYGVRMLRRWPWLTATVVIALGLGIGVNVAIFSIINGFLLRPLPVRAPAQIVVLASEQTGAPLGAYLFSYPDFSDLRNQTGDAFSELLAYQIGMDGLSDDGKTNQLELSYVTGNYFSMLGVNPAMGRLILPTDGETHDSAADLVLGYSFWQRRFGGDPEVIGKQVLVHGRLATIIGVVPKEFHGLSSSLEMDGYMPLSLSAGEGAPNELSTDRKQRRLTVVGRLRPDVNLKQAQSSVNVIANRLAAQYPGADQGFAVGVIPEPLARPVPQPNNAAPVIAGLFVALALLVLILACVNAAHVVLARSTMRQQELRIRAALGATRGRLVRQLLTEASLLVLIGGIVGVMLGQWAVSAIVSIVPASDSAVHLDFALDWRVFAYALIVVAITAIVIGGWPALSISRSNANLAQQAGSRGDTVAAGSHRVRNALVIAQLASSLTLLIVAGLLVRSLAAVKNMRLGFDPENLLSLTVDPSELGYNQSRTDEFYGELETSALALPGVQSVSLAHNVPMISNSGDTVYVEGRALMSGQQPPLVLYNIVGPGYFDTMRIPLVAGRDFLASDDSTAPLVAVVNQTMADQFWPNENPVGKRFSTKSATGPVWQVIGVAGNGKYQIITEAPRPYFYAPLAQSYRSMRTLQVRSSVRPEFLASSLQKVVRVLAPDLPIIQLQAMKLSLQNAVTGYFIFRFGASLAAAMGLLGLILAIVGIYGIVSFTAALRTHEIGVRMALGACPRDVLVFILRQGARLVAAGVAVGLFASWLLTRVLLHILIGVSPTDPLTVRGRRDFPGGYRVVRVLGAGS